MCVSPALKCFSLSGDITMGTAQTSDLTRTHTVRIQIKTPPGPTDAGDHVGTTRWQTVNDGLLFDFSKYMNRIEEIDHERRRARVQPGIVLDNLQQAANHFGL